MMLRFILSVFVLSSVLHLSGQSKNESQTLKEQATKMGEAFVRGDYATLANYTYPLIVKSMGGTVKMIEVLSKGASDMKAHGMWFSKISFDEPSKIVKSLNELQATITQHTEIKLSQGRVVSTSTLLAISSNNGKDWKFVDTSNKEMATLKKALPNLSRAINIPPMQSPVKYEN